MLFLTKEEKRLLDEVKRGEGKLSNEGFVSKAPQKIIDEERAKLEEYKEMLAKVKDRLVVISEKIGKYKAMLEDFNEKIIQRGRIETADTLLLTVNARAVVHLAEECQNLYSSVCVLAAYASGQVCCTTASLMLMIDNINKSLDRIKDIVNSAYYQTWKFIQARTSYWKSEIYRSKTIRQVATEAFDRWMEAGNILDY